MDQEFSIKKAVQFFLCISLGSVFIFSGIVKLFPIEPFEYNFTEQGIASWELAPFIARLLIGLELFIGGAIITLCKPKFILQLSLAVLVIFTAYLFYILYKDGNSGNCGCFGNFFKMTPLESIFKNALMISVNLFLLYSSPLSFNWKPSLILIVLAVLSIAIPFVVNPVNLHASDLNRMEKVGYAFQDSLLGEINYRNKVIDLKKGDHIVAFFSMECSHCRKAAYKLHVISKRINTAPILMVLNGPEQMLPDFFAETKADFPYKLFNDKNFSKLTGPSFPVIFYLKNGVVIKKWGLHTLTEEEIVKTSQN